MKSVSKKIFDILEKIRWTDKTDKKYNELVWELCEINEHHIYQRYIAEWHVESGDKFEKYLMSSVVYMYKL